MVKEVILKNSGVFALATAMTSEIDFKIMIGTIWDLVAVMQFF